MFEKVFEKRSVSVEGFNWSTWVKGEEDIITSKKDSAYSACLNILSSSVAKLSLEIKQDTEKGEKVVTGHNLYEMLRLRPNSNMSSYSMLYSLISMYKHYGVAGIYIDRGKNGTIYGLYPVKINQFTIDDKGIIKSDKINKVLVDFTCIDVQGSCLENDIIIIRDNSFDGIHGKDIKSSIDDTIDSNIKANKYQAELFSNGLTNKAVVQLTSDLKDEKDLKKVQNKFNKIYSNRGRIFTVPAGYNVTPLNLNLADSQFSELKILGKKDVAAALQVPFSFIDDMKNISEQEILSFITNTISPILISIEQEADYKLLSPSERKQGYKIRFNINGLLRTTPKTQQEIICNYVKQGVYSLNYGKKLAGAPLLDEDVTVFPSGQVTLDQLMNGDVSYLNGKGGEGSDGED